jgi:hypothetical protein
VAGRQYRPDHARRSQDNLEIFTGRGRPFKRTFCNIHYQRQIFEGKGDFLRKRSIENVMAEFKQNLARYDVKFVRCTTTTSRPIPRGSRSSARPARAGKGELRAAASEIERYGPVSNAAAP